MSQRIAGLLRLPAVLWLLYFCLLLWAAMPEGFSTSLVSFPPPSPCTSGTHCQGEALTPLSTNADIIRLFQTADPAYVANKAKEIVDTRDWRHVTGWPLWPPGMIALEVLCYWLLPALPVALVLIVLGCGLWAGVFMRVSQYARDKGMGSIASFMLPLALMLSNEFSYFFRLGVFYSESYTTAAFLLGFGLLLSASATRNVAQAVGAGIFLALSAYIRAQTDLVMTATLGVFAVCILWKLIREEKSVRYAAFAHLFRTCAWLAVLGVTLATYYAATFPYRAAHNMQWINMAGSPMWPPTWDYKKDIPPMLEFYITGGGVEGCEIDPGLCESIHRQRAEKGENVFSKRDYFHFTLQSIFHHPLRWAEFKYPYLWDFWMENPNEAVVLSLLLPMVFAVCLRSRDDKHILLGMLLCTTGFAIIGPLLLTHFESRYLYQFKLLILYAALGVIADAYAEDAYKKK